MKHSFRNVAIAAACLLTVGGVVYAQTASSPSDWAKGSTEDQLKALAGIQPGLGTVMMEYSARYTNAYYAAKGGNWELAAYMLKEQLEIQEVGETTRPARTDALKAFETSYLEPLDAAIKAKNFETFETAFNKGVKGCNGCHSAAGFPFIEYSLPATPPAPLKFTP
jgi:hypothetical protein